MRYQISGQIAQRVRLDFEPGESAWVSKGSLIAHSPGLQWRLRLVGGASGAVRRLMAGEGAALTQLSTEGRHQFAEIASNLPGHIYPWDLSDGAVLATRGAFLAAWGPDLEITAAVARRAGAAFFGGTGFFLQKISGTGRLLISGSGDFVEHHLEAGEQMLVSTGNLAAFSQTVDYDIQSVGGCRTKIFGGEGFFMTRLTGPGRVLLQTLKRTRPKPPPAQ